MSNDDQLTMNQAHILIPDDGHEEEVDPADLAPFISGNTPIITVPASEVEEGQEEMEDMYNFLGEISEQIQEFKSTMQGSISSSQPPVVPDDKLWDTGLAWEREFNLHPDASRSVIISRLYNQVWDLLQKMKERVTRQTWKVEDLEIVEGLINIMILSVRNNILSNKIIKDQVEKHAG